jgi:hypothetical protein
MKEEREGKSRLPVVAASIFFLLPFLYILSIGPAIGIVAKTGKKSHLEIYTEIYRPLFEAMDKFPVLEKALNDYCAPWAKFPFKSS